MLTVATGVVSILFSTSEWPKSRKDTGRICVFLNPYANSLSDRRRPASPGWSVASEARRDRRVRLDANGDRREP